MDAKHTEIARLLFPQLARIGRAVASPARLQLLNLLMQAPRTVEVLAEMTGHSVANASQHLQQLKRANLVASDKHGQHVIYRLASDDVARFYVMLCTLAAHQLAELDRVTRAIRRTGPIDVEGILRRIRRDEVTLLDVRPAEEYRAGHVRGALSIPLPELPARLAELPRRRDVVAYCRGAFCVMAEEAVLLLQAHGFRAHPLDLSVVEMRDHGLRLDGAAPSPPPRRAAAPRSKSTATPRARRGTT